MMTFLLMLLTCGPRVTADGIAPAESTRAPHRTLITIAVEARADIPRSIVKRTLEETGAIWKSSGVQLQWDRTPSPHNTDGAIRVDLIVDDEDGGGRTGELPLGWITFDSEGVPESVIHLSRSNGMRVLNSVASYRRLPDGEQEVLVSRALGRALAHELGHLLLESKAHAREGLMRSRLSVDDLFAASRSGFGLDAEQQERVTQSLNARFSATVCATGARP